MPAKRAVAAKIAAIFNQKGGCAKTMTTMQVGGVMASVFGLRVGIIDMDPQGTGMIWSAQAGEDDPFPAKVISMAPLKELMIGEIRKMINEYDVILIDCPPAIESPIPWAALQIADIGLIPVKPVLDNIWASKKAKELALRARQDNPSLQTFYVSSMMQRGNIFKSCLEMLKEDGELPMLKSQIWMRNAFPESQAYGSTVCGLSKTSEASKEVTALAKEILGKLEIKVR